MLDRHAPLRTDRCRYWPSRDVLDSADEVLKSGGKLHLVVVGTGLIANKIKGEVSSAVACRVLRSSPPGFAKENNQCVERRPS